MGHEAPIELTLLCPASTWNIWFDQAHAPEARWAHLFDELFAPAVDGSPPNDVVALQEVTKQSYTQLLSHHEVQRHWILTDCELVSGRGSFGAAC